MCGLSGRSALRYAASLLALRTYSRPCGAVDTKSCSMLRATVAWLAFGRKVGEDSVEDAHAGPANEPVVERLMGAIDRGRIPPSQTIPDHMDYPASTRGMPRVRGKKGSMRLS